MKQLSPLDEHKVHLYIQLPNPAEISKHQIKAMTLSLKNCLFATKRNHDCMLTKTLMKFRMSSIREKLDTNKKLDFSLVASSLISAFNDSIASSRAGKTSLSKRLWTTANPSSSHRSSFE